MIDPYSPFSLPADLPNNLAQVVDYWKRLRRGENAIPFSDDLALSSLPDMSDKLFLLDVFANPARCRFSQIGSTITDCYGVNVAGKFADEIEARAPLNHVGAQSSATVEDRGPTFYRHRGYARVMLPMWGGGRIDIILGAVVQS